MAVFIKCELCELRSNKDFLTKANMLHKRNYQKASIAKYLQQFVDFLWSISVLSSSDSVVTVRSTFSLFFYMSVFINF